MLQGRACGASRDQPSAASLWPKSGPQRLLFHSIVCLLV